MAKRKRSIGAHPQANLAVVPPGFRDDVVAPRRCSHLRTIHALNESKVKDLWGYRLDDSGRLKEAISRSGFFIGFAYCDGHSSDLRGYIILDPNYEVFERASRQSEDSWLVERLNPAKGRIEKARIPYTYVKVDEQGNIVRVQLSGHKEVVSIRMEQQQLIDALIPAKFWVAI